VPKKQNWLTRVSTRHSQSVAECVRYIDPKGGGIKSNVAHSTKRRGESRP
jgi:hypothetical protein